MTRLHVRQRAATVAAVIAAVVAVTAALSRFNSAAVVAGIAVLVLTDVALGARRDHRRAVAAAEPDRSRTAWPETPS